MQKSLKLIIILIVLITIGLVGKNYITRFLFLPRSGNSTEISQTVNTSTPQNGKGQDIEVVAEGLKIPWEIAFLPTGEMLVTERPGNLLKIGSDKKIIKVDGVYHTGEGGLLGLALDPNFPNNNYIYLYLTARDGGRTTNRVERYTLATDSIKDRKVIVSGINGSSNHDGGRIRFGPDGYLYITTGDAENPQSAQDKNSLNGKILRVNKDGQPPADNPFGNAVYSYGHRNIQGIAWDEKGNLWATEHGPSGGQTGNDEINLVKKGANYGWPDIKGTAKKEGMESPNIESGRGDTWAPAGISYYKTSLYFTGLRGEALYRAKIGSDNKLTLTEHFKETYGRLRTVEMGPDGYFYIVTNNTDGRGSPKSGDDKIIKINPEMFLR